MSGRGAGHHYHYDAARRRYITTSKWKSICGRAGADIDGTSVDFPIDFTTLNAINAIFPQKLEPWCCCRMLSQSEGTLLPTWSITIADSGCQTTSLTPFHVTVSMANLDVETNAYEANSNSLNFGLLVTTDSFLAKDQNDGKTQ
jgi:hypothetical protein